MSNFSDFNEPASGSLSAAEQKGASEGETRTIRCEVVRIVIRVQHQSFQERKPMTIRQSGSGIPSTFAQVEASEFDKSQTYQDKGPHVTNNKRRRPIVLPESPDQAKREEQPKESVEPTSLQAVVNTRSNPVFVGKSANASDPASRPGLLQSDEQKKLAKVEANIADIQKCFDIGKQLDKECPRHAQDGLIAKRAWFVDYVRSTVA